MPLNDPKVKNAKALESAYKLSDAGGLYLLVQPSGSKLWRLNYRFAGKQKTLALGMYPAVSLSRARDDRAAARAKLRDGIDPSAEKQETKAAVRMAATNSFESVAREWLSKQTLAPVTAKKTLWMFEALTFPWIGSKGVAEIKAPDVLAVLRRIEARGKLETAQRVKQQAGRVFRYAVATGRAESDPTAALRGALKTPITRHHSAITDPKLVGPLLRSIDGFDGTFIVACALKIAPLTFVRPGELRHAEWSEFDLDGAEWRIPAGKMKMKSAHIIPLCEQAVAVLRDLQPLTGSGRYVFPSSRGKGKAMSEGTVLSALRRLGYTGEEMSGHGFRAMARTLLAEKGWQPEIIERQLAHKASGPLGEAYDRTQYLVDRRKMMQDWADYLDALKEQRTVVAGKFGRAA